MMKGLFISCFLILSLFTKANPEYLCLKDSILKDKYKQWKRKSSLSFSPAYLIPSNQLQLGIVYEHYDHLQIEKKNWSKHFGLFIGAENNLNNGTWMPHVKTWYSPMFLRVFSFGGGMRFSTFSTPYLFPTVGFTPRLWRRTGHKIKPPRFYELPQRYYFHLEWDPNRVQKFSGGLMFYFGNRRSYAKMHMWFPGLIYFLRFKT